MPQVSQAAMRPTQGRPPANVTTPAHATGRPAGEGSP
jgi:hypothetical protein